MAKEVRIQSEIMMALSKVSGVVVFRSNTGIGYQGEVSKSSDGCLVLRNPRIIKFGLTNGSSDIVGWKKIKITPDMVGKEVAIFTAVEVKNELGRVTPEQKNFLDTVSAAGGIAFVARSAQQAVELIQKT